MTQVNWVIFDGFKMFVNKDRLGYLYQLGEVETKYYIEQSISDLAKAYYRLVTELKLRDSYAASQEISEYRRKLEKQKLDVGSGNALLYYQAVVDYNTDSSMLVNQEMLIDNRATNRTEAGFKLNVLVAESERGSGFGGADPATLKRGGAEAGVLARTSYTSSAMAPGPG
jgi:hypothetical protein